MANSDVQAEAQYVESQAKAFVHMDGKSEASITAGDHLFREVDGYLRQHPEDTKALQAQFNADSAADKLLPRITVEDNMFMVQPGIGDTSPVHSVRAQSR